MSRTSKPPTGTQVDAALTPFALFCAYHLGLTPAAERRFMHIHDVAALFSIGVAEVRAALERFALDSDTLLHTRFDLAGAQADIQLSPPGVDLLDLARMHFDALAAARGQPRDWEAELMHAAEENRALFGEDEAG